MADEHHRDSSSSFVNGRSVVAVFLESFEWLGLFLFTTEKGKREGEQVGFSEKCLLLKQGSKMGYGLHFMSKKYISCAVVVVVLCRTRASTHEKKQQGK